MKSINKNFSSESIQIGISTSTVILNNDQNDLLIEIPLITTNILNNLDFSIVYSYMNRFSNYAFLGMGVKHNYYTKIVKKPTTDNNIYKVELQDGRVATFEEKDDEYYSEDFNMHINKNNENIELIDSMGNMLSFKLDENYPYILSTSKNVEYPMEMNDECLRIENPDNYYIEVTIKEYSEEQIGEINPIRYKGYYYDSETLMYYLMTRYLTKNYVDS